jgi:hypothetical protein
MSVRSVFTELKGKDCAFGGGATLEKSNLIYFNPLLGFHLRYPHYELTPSPLFSFSPVYFPSLLLCLLCFLLLPQGYGKHNSQPFWLFVYCLSFLGCGRLKQGAVEETLGKRASMEVEMMTTIFVKMVMMMVEMMEACLEVDWQFLR